jgi:hypothetical protein
MPPEGAGDQVLNRSLAVRQVVLQQGLDNATRDVGIAVDLDNPARFVEFKADPPVKRASGWSPPPPPPRAGLDRTLPAYAWQYRCL